MKYEFIIIIFIIFILISYTTREHFHDWSLYNIPIMNGYIPNIFSYPLLGSSYTSPQNAYNTSLSRIYNPLQYPYKSQAFYEQPWMPNMYLPPNVIGCGGRRQPCLGGSQETILNVPTQIDISERNISPVNIQTRGPVGVPQQIGVLYKIFGSLNEIYPLYGRKRFPNTDIWDYYTEVGQLGNKVKVPIQTKRKTNNELSTNDTVKIRGNSAEFRVTVYKDDFPMYIPYVN